MGRWTPGPGRWGARRTDCSDGSTPCPTMPCHSPSWDAIATFFPALHPSYIQTHAYMQTQSPCFGSKLRRGKRSHLLCRFQDFPAEKQQRFTGGEEVMTEWSSDRIFLSFIAARVHIPIPRGTTCAKNACICYTMSGESVAGLVPTKGTMVWEEKRSNGRALLTIILGLLLILLLL